MTGKNLNLFILFVGFLMYAFLGAIGMRTWRRRRGRPPVLQADPDAWTSYWMPLIIAEEVWGLLGVAPVCVLMVTTLPMYRGADAALYKLALGIGVIGIAMCLALFDILAFTHARRLASRHLRGRDTR